MLNQEVISWDRGLACVCGHERQSGWAEDMLILIHVQQQSHISERMVGKIWLKDDDDDEKAGLFNLTTSEKYREVGYFHGYVCVELPPK